MKKILAYTFLSATFLLSGVLENSYTKEDFEKIDNRSGEEIAKEYVENENKKLPIKQDEITEITKIIAINTKIYFIKEINKNKKTKSKKLTLQEMYESTRSYLCKNTLNRAYIDKKNLGFQYDHYESNTKEYIGSYSIDKNDCIKMEQEQKSKGKYSLY